MTVNPLRFFVAGAPVGKGRPRFSRLSGRAFTPAKTANTEAFVKSEALRQVGQPVLVGPLALQVEAIATVPDSWSKRKRGDALAGTVRPTGKPDLDNLAKLYADALNGILWKDDSQLVEMQLSKRYGETPGVPDRGRRMAGRLQAGPAGRRDGQLESSLDQRVTQVQRRKTQTFRELFG